MTEAGKKSIPKLVFGVVTVLYYAVWIFWLVFPAWLTFFAVPYLTGFLKDIGQELPPVTIALMEYSHLCGIICSSVNIGFPLWRFFAKAHRKDVFSSKLFFWWVLATNLVLIVWLIIGAIPRGYP